MKKTQQGFTLIKLIVVVFITTTIIVVSIINILTLVINPNLTDTPKRVVCVSGNSALYEGTATKVRMFDNHIELTDTLSKKRKYVIGDCVIVQGEG